MVEMNSSMMLEVLVEEDTHPVSQNQENISFLVVYVMEVMTMEEDLWLIENNVSIRWAPLSRMN